MQGLRGTMKRTRALKIVIPLLGICLINQVVTGLIHGKIPDETYEVLHGGGGILLALAALIHAVLNWNWISANYFRAKRPGV
jgi:anthranilate/para-aminobenzoate synthase component II